MSLQSFLADSNCASSEVIKRNNVCVLTTYIHDGHEVAFSITNTYTFYKQFLDEFPVTFVQIQNKTLPNVGGNVFFPKYKLPDGNTKIDLTGIKNIVNEMKNVVFNNVLL